MSFNFSDDALETRMAAFAATQAIATNKTQVGIAIIRRALQMSDAELSRWLRQEQKAKAEAPAA